MKTVSPIGDCKIHHNGRRQRCPQPESQSTRPRFIHGGGLGPLQLSCHAGSERLDYPQICQGVRRSRPDLTHNESLALRTVPIAADPGRVCTNPLMPRLPKAGRGLGEVDLGSIVSEQAMPRRRPARQG